MKKRFILATVFCLICAVLLSGCMAPATAQNDGQAKNRQYMEKVNTIMGSIEEDLKDFSTTVKSGEVVSLTSQLSDVNKQVEALKAMEVPADMTEIHASYVKGAEELQTALTDYVSLYQNSKHGSSLDGASLASIQEHYNAGIEALKEADSKVTQA